MMNVNEIKNIPQDIADEDRIAQMEAYLMEMIDIVDKMPILGKENGPAANREPNKTAAY